MPAGMLCIHKITYIHHAEGCEMHRGHHISFRVAALLPHDSWRATVFLLHVPFYGHQLGAYNVFHVEKNHRLFLMKHRIFSQHNGSPVIPSIHDSTHLSAHHCRGVPDLFLKDSHVWHHFFWDLDYRQAG